MSTPQESWKDVAEKVESLGLKLKLHLEQEEESDDDVEVGDAKAAVEDLGRKLEDAFDAFGNAAKDPAVHADFKDIGMLVKDALLNTFNAVGVEVDKVMRKVEDAGNTAGDKITEAISTDKIVDTTADEAASVQDSIEGAVQDTVDEATDEAG